MKEIEAKLIQAFQEKHPTVKTADDVKKIMNANHQPQKTTRLGKRKG